MGSEMCIRDRPHRESPPGPDARTDGPPTPAWHPVRPPGTHLRSGPRKKGRKSRPTPGTPTRARSRVCRATHGLPLQAQTGPRRQGVTTGDNRVTRKEGPKIARSHRTDGGTHPVPRPRGGPGRSARAEEEPPAGAGRPTQAARTASSGSEAEATAATAATATLPRSSGGPISGERIARRGPGDSRTLAPEPPSSWNSAPGNRHQSCSLPVAAEPPEGTRSIKAAARWHPTTGANDSGTDPGGEAVRAPRISPLGPGTAEGPGSTRPRTARTPVLPGRGSLGKPVRPSVRPSGPCLLYTSDAADE